MFPNLETKITDPDPLPIFTSPIPSTIIRYHNYVLHALLAKQLTAYSTMVSPVE